MKGFFIIFFKELWATKSKTVLDIGWLALVLIIVVTAVYKNFKSKQLCLLLINNQLKGEIANKLEEYSGVEGRAVYDYCAKIDETEMTTEPFPFWKWNLYIYFLRSFGLIKPTTVMCVGVRY